MVQGPTLFITIKKQSLRISPVVDMSKERNSEGISGLAPTEGTKSSEGHSSSSCPSGEGGVVRGHDPSEHLGTSEDTFEGYSKTLVRKLSKRWKKHPCSEVKRSSAIGHRVKDGEASGEEDEDPPAADRLSTALLADYRYATDGARRGRAVLVNNATFEDGTDVPDRPNTARDTEALASALKGLGFRTGLYQDLKCAQIQRLVKLLSGEDHSDADCLLVAVMTHGDDGEVYGTDGPMPVRHITAPFRGDSCRSLIGKPKIFIFQACRGDLVDRGVAMRRHDVDQPDALIGYSSARTVPVEADFLVAYSCPEGYASWRNTTDGAWFIQSLARAIQAYGNSWEFTRILTLVNRMVALQYESLSENTFMTRKKQMPCFLSTLTKELYFRPKGAPSE